LITSSARSSHPGDGVVERFDVLDVDRGHHVDPRVEQCEHVLEALGVPAPRRVRVGQFVDQGDGGPARQHGVQVHLLHLDAAVRHPAPGDDLQLADLGLGVGAAVGLDESDHHVQALFPQQVGVAQHQVGLAHAGRRSDVDAEPGMRPVLEAGQQSVRGRGRRRCGHQPIVGVPVAPAPDFTVFLWTF
jgi:hypothetical protein